MPVRVWPMPPIDLLTCPPLLRHEEAAEALHLTVGEVRKLLASGHLLGNCVYIRAGSVRGYISAQQQDLLRSPAKHVEEREGAAEVWRSHRPSPGTTAAASRLPPASAVVGWCSNCRPLVHRASQRDRRWSRILARPQPKQTRRTERRSRCNPAPGAASCTFTCSSEVRPLPLCPTGNCPQPRGIRGL